MTKKYNYRFNPDDVQRWSKEAEGKGYKSLTMYIQATMNGVRTNEEKLKEIVRTNIKQPDKQEIKQEKNVYTTPLTGIDVRTKFPELVETLDDLTKDEAKNKVNTLFVTKKINAVEKIALFNYINS